MLERAAEGQTTGVKEVDDAEDRGQTRHRRAPGRGWFRRTATVTVPAKNFDGHPIALQLGLAERFRKRDLATWIK